MLPAGIRRPYRDHCGWPAGQAEGEHWPSGRPLLTARGDRGHAGTAEAARRVLPLYSLPATVAADWRILSRKELACAAMTGEAREVLSAGVRRTLAAAALVCAALLALAGAGRALAASPAPYGQHDAGGFLNVLPAGEAGVDNAAQFAQFESTGKPPPHFEDQLPLYANLVYADPTLTPPQVHRYFKHATFGIKPGHTRSVEHPEAGLTIVRDTWDVPHIYGQTQ